MKIRCVWEHHGNDTLLYSDNFVGAFTRGASREEALEKMPSEIRSYLRWKNAEIPTALETELVQEKESDLEISDADSDVLFEEERRSLSVQEYQELKELVLRSARDFERLYQAIPDKEKSSLPVRKTFYGQVPRTASEMYEHTKNVNQYYFDEIGVPADNEGTILECRRRGFEQLENQADFLDNRIFDGSYGESWTLRKVLRRFIWHDRIHGKAMYRMAVKTFGADAVPDIFCFDTFGG